MDTTLTPTDLFSPSKARLQRAQAHDWAAVDSWLSLKYPGRAPPSFERNDDTLKALLALATANERADDERRLVERVERAALGELRVLGDEDEEDEDGGGRAGVISALMGNLTSEGNIAVDALSRAAVSVDAIDMQPETLAHRTITLSQTSARLTTHLETIDKQHTYLSTLLAALTSDLRALRDEPAFAPSSTALATQQQQTADRVRQTKQLRAKLAEYEARIASLPRLGSSAGGKAGGGGMGSAAAVQGLVDEEGEVEELMKAVEEVEGQVRAYKGLPENSREARKVVKKLADEIDGLRTRRDELFEGLVS